MILGLCGKARIGKDTVGKMLVDEGREIAGVRPYGPAPTLITYALASPIKKIINEAFGWDGRHSEGHLKEVDVVVTSPTRVQFMATLNQYLFGLSEDQILSITDEFSQRIKHFSTGSFIVNGVISPRRAYQLFGTEVARGVSETLWIDQAQIKVDAGESLIITDTRFENEATWIRSQGGFLIHIEREDAAEVSEHSSELGIKKTNQDVKLLNNGGLSQLRGKVAYLYNTMILSPLDAFNINTGDST